MFTPTRGGVAVCYVIFMAMSCMAIVEEYTTLFMKQLGYSATFIGFVPILGLVTQSVGIPLLGFLADKFRARKLILFLSILLSIPTCLLFLAQPIPKPDCKIPYGNLPDGNTLSISSPDAINNATHKTFAFQRRNYTKELYNLNRNASPPHHGVFSRRFQTIANVGLSPESHSNITRNNNEDDVNDRYRLKFFFIFIGIRGMYELFKRISLNMIVVAIMTHLKDDKTKFGYYVFWGDVGAGLSLFLVGILVDQIKEEMCGNLVPNYSIIYFYAAVVYCLALASLPWIKFDYLQQRVIDCAEVTRVLCNPHYILMLLICCYTGGCTAFQTRWEFWYMEKLGGSTIVMAVGGLVRRPLNGIAFLLSRRAIDRVGELNIIAISLFMMAATFGALAFIENAWLVILVDNFQSSSFVFIFSSVVIHFSKAGSKASTAFFQGLVGLTMFGVGKEITTAISGFLFSTQGTRITLCAFSLLMVFIIFSIYILTAKDLDDYTQVPIDDDNDLTD